MHTKYTDIFDKLIKAYYVGDFEHTLNRIMEGHDQSPQETYTIICSLCGVNIPFDNNYVYNLKKAITQYAVNKRIVEKLDDCTIHCPSNKNNKFSCQTTCPFDAITYDDSKKSSVIDEKLCLDCGLCIDGCSTGRILDKVEFIPIKDLIDNNKTVVAAVDPSILGQYGPDVTMDKLRAAFMKIGFSDMFEVAFAADLLTIKQAVEFNNHVNNSNDILITSCSCPLWVEMLKKDYPELVKDLSPSVSPMIAAGKVIKSLNKDAKVVFISPCIARKAEAISTDIHDVIDFVLTYQEVDEIFQALDIRPNTIEGVPFIDYASRGGRLYGRAGGESAAINDVLQELYPEKSKIFTPVIAEGIDECKNILEKALKGSLKANYIEGLACKGGCVGGPKILIPPHTSCEALNKFAIHSPIKVPTHSNTLDKILEQFNIKSLKDFEDKDKIEFLQRDFLGGNDSDS